MGSCNEYQRGYRNGDQCHPCAHVLWAGSKYGFTPLGSSGPPLQCVLNAAARIVSGTRKFDCGLTHLLHSELHWLDVPERIQHKLGVTVHRSLQGKALQYLIECCTPTSEVASCQRLRSASHHQLVVPRYRRSKFGRWAFSGTQRSALIVSSHA